MQLIYTTIFNTVYKLTSKVSDKVRNVGMFVCCAFLVWIYFFSKLWLDKLNVEVMGSVAIVLMTVLSANTEMQPVKWNKWVYYSMVLFGFGILAIELVHPVGEGFTVYAIDLIVVFPAFYYVWSNRKDYRTLYIIMSVALVAAGIISFFYSIWLSFRGELVISGIRVSGHKTNPNYLGMMGIASFIAGLYLLSEFRASIGITALASAGTGIGLVYMIISVARTAMVSSVICVVAYAVFYIKGKQQREAAEKDKWIRRLIIIGMIALTVFVGLNLNDINYMTLANKGQLTEESANLAETSEATNLTGRIGTEEKNANSFSSGRTSIWEVYLRNLSWVGRPLSDIQDEFDNPVEIRAHNNFIDYYYRLGYIVASLYTLFHLAVGIIGLFFLFKKEYSKPQYAFVVMVIGMFSVYAMLEISFLPFIRLIPCLFFMSIAPVLTYRSDIANG